MGGRVVGVDEAGRGPLAGPVVAAAVWIDRARCPEGLDDSKALCAARREVLHDKLHGVAVIGVGMASVEEIDRLNILWATMLAMERAVAALACGFDHVLVDGNRLPRWHHPATAVVGGDALCVSIAAASIIAKVTRDRLMEALDAEHPGYGWARNKGYGTADHARGLAEHGPTIHHRRSFAPVRAMLPGL
ncbi:ribonuclease HII [Polymorphobacter fuscus]|uniref:Ribonuclease HII n=1 Tax=Sandarakinorhabdus fusca TaxID=1439888 RepID=A0A7C9KY33_9SPHN|nr:ribonuclease HII [Polymorphobacter fuscus]KAB7649113.1 ribonuclease HII [Polymorphobacter fuscus]MQT16468.1 ribonuclease HII [Polymorphobacter fuscus]